MKCFEKNRIEAAALKRPEGYLDEIKKLNKSPNDIEFCLEKDDLDYIRKRFVIPGAMPSIPQMAKGLVKSAVGEVKATIKGEPSVSKDLRDHRINTCNRCEFYTPNIAELPQEKRDAKRCTKCGCFMAAKTWLRSATCPVGKW